jgi:2-succinyl-5-enolpyruvyl-6-hydroxy-3-cyclohexene-1-carboxylate synthase
VITKAFFTAKTFRAHSTNYLRQEKNIRDHGAMARRKSGIGQDNSKKRVRACSGKEGRLVNPSTAFGAVLADELARCGLREVVIAPGSRSAPLAMAFDELDRVGRVRLHVRIDERSASFTALGLAKASGRPVAVVCTSGTAAANFHPAVIEADESAVPLLVLTADRPPELRGTGASQTVDQVKLYGSAVRWYAESGVPERIGGMAGYWRSLAGRAWAHAAGDLGALPGPVHLNIPLRDPLVPDAEPIAPSSTPAPAQLASNSLPSAAPVHPTRSELEAADWPDSLAGRPDGASWTRIGGAGSVAAPLELPWAERGVVVCGDGDYDAAALVSLAEEAGWPVLAEPSSGARRGPNALTGYQYLLASPEFMAAHRPTVIVSAGRPGLTRPQSRLLRLARDEPSVGPASAAAGTGSAGNVSAGTGSAGTGSAGTGWAGDASAASPVRHVVIAQGPGMWADPQRAATDVAAAVRLTGAPDRASAGESAADSWLAQWRSADAAATAAATAVLDAWRGGDLSEPEVAREVVAALPGGALLWCGNSLSVRDVDLALPPQTNARVMASRGASGIDGTFSTAAGAALAHAADHTGTVAFALIGDLSLLHDAPGLAIGPGEPRPDLCVVVVNNDGGGIFEGLEPARFGGGVSGRPTAGQSEGQSEGRPDRSRAQGTPGAQGTTGAQGGPTLTVFERTFGTPHGVSVEHLAAAFGLPYSLAERPGEIAKAVAATVPGGGPRIVEARTGRAPNADLRARMRAAALATLAPTIG